MHPTIDRIRQIRKEMARQLWEPVSITLGWMSYDALQDELADLSSHSYPSETTGTYIFGIEVVRDPSFPIGGCVRLDREVYASPMPPYKRQTEHLTVPL